MAPWAKLTCAQRCSTFAHFCRSSKLEEAERILSWKFITMIEISIVWLEGISLLKGELRLWKWNRIDHLTIKITFRNGAAKTKLEKTTRHSLIQVFLTLISITASSYVLRPKPNTTLYGSLPAFFGSLIYYLGQFYFTRVCIVSTLFCRLFSLFE